jgi:hypothetical protein
MWTEWMDMIVALVAFIGFPFLVIGAAAGLLVLFNHVFHPNHHGHHPA